MRPNKLWAALTCVALLIGACAGTDTSNSTTTTDSGSVASTTSTTKATNGGDMGATVTALQDEVNSFTQSVQDSQASAEIGSAWTDLQSKLAVSLASLQTDGTVDTEALQKDLDDFEAVLNDAASSIEPEVRDSWDTLRAQFEDVMSQLGS
ncbi:MAG: hypothetical protein WAN34_05805 [Acidimicrobiia bacterium]